mmetsp:Transcript_56013/g.167697  ORF Transcript_56013/g.167697 Transcript_56013/m.167697 type:complete len:328 (-) Transcript_56013:530-1513(-)|eukprot:CAMPEP_0113550856 /NCGR_PEP_ID=MMETSP0015_2-20120614/14209_1 /TAXON_ID=2838 /ORGANISM="Odontella" /LENGTH=327 /DNA_ID=CAMNT_0000451699 /DNA_START=28 /DNA_END=1011 /DNA_ORIENTATION=- /assembly_acc=CAM_ASM_000160
MNAAANDVTHDLKEKFAVMRTQDETAYRCEDYLSEKFQRRLQRTAQAIGSDDSLPSMSDSSSSSDSGINVEWREKIIDWCYQVVDHFEFSREIVNVAMSYLDRYLSVTSRVANKRTYQLAAMTSFHLAVKLYEQRRTAMNMDSLVSLSRGYFTKEHVVAMEASILNALAYRVHPPTAICFYRHMFLLLPASACAPIVRHDMEEVGKFLLELSVFEYELATRNKSSVAVAAVLFAMSRVDEHSLSRRSRAMFLENIMKYSCLDPECHEVAECHEKLALLYAPYQEELRAAPDVPATEDTTDLGRESTVSPVSVAGFPPSQIQAYAPCQ